MRKPDPVGVLTDLREAIAAEVDSVIRHRIRGWRIQTWVLYVLVFIVIVGVTWVGVRFAQDISSQAGRNRALIAENRATSLSLKNTITQLCDVAGRQRAILERQSVDVHAYLKTPTGREGSGLNNYIREFSIPQLTKRLKDETVPPLCRTGGPLNVRPGP